MNWMTSGRKRVQRSQKVKELRAKHFAKVAADRARAPASQPSRATSSSLRQSNDVSRLKSRWTLQQQPASAHTVAATVQRTVPNSAMGYTSAAPAATDSTPPASVFAPLGPGTTPDSDSFQPGSLHLDITPPFNATSRKQYGSSCGGTGVSRGAGAVLATDGVSQHPGGEAIDRSGAQRPRLSLLHVEPSVSSPALAQAHTRGPLGRRQLVFSGRDCATGGPGFGEDCEGQLVGNEGVGVDVGDSTGAVPQENQHRGEWMVSEDDAVGGAVGRASLPVGQDQFREERGQGQGHPMRFFNAGIEVAHDGSPVSATATASSPPLPPLASSSARRLDLLANNRDNNNTNADFVSTGSGNVRGLPRFSMGAVRRGNNRPPATPSDRSGRNLPKFSRSAARSGNNRPPSNPLRSSGRNLPWDTHNDQHSLDGDHSTGSVFDREPAPSSQMEDDTHCYEHNQPSYPPNEDDTEPREEHCNADVGGDSVIRGGGVPGPRGPSRDAAPPAGIEVLARTWGLFGGALDSPQDTMDTDKNPALAELSKNDTADRRAVGVVAGNRRVRSGNGEEGARRLQVSVPIRATPHVVDLVQNHQPETSESQPIPPLRTDDHHRSYCSASPELTMDFVEESESRRPEAAAAGQAATEPLSGDRRVSPLTTSTSSLPLTTDNVRHSLTRQATSGNLPQGPLATTTEESDQKQDEQPSLTARKMLASRMETKSNIEGTADPPNSTAGADLPDGGHQLHRLPSERSAKPPEDAVNVGLLSGGGGRDMDVGGSGTRAPPSTGLTAAGECDKVDNAKRTSTVGVTRTSRSRTSAAKGGGTRSAHIEANSNPLFPAHGPTTAATGLEAPSSDAIVGPPSSESESRKRARGVGGKPQYERRRRNDDHKPPARMHRGADGESGGQQNHNTGHHGSVVGVDSKNSGSGRGGCGGSVGRGGRHATADMNGANVFESDSRSGVGQNKRVARWYREEGDAYSTVVWYKTIVACLAAAST